MQFSFKLRELLFPINKNIPHHNGGVRNLRKPCFEAVYNLVTEDTKDIVSFQTKLNKGFAHIKHRLVYKNWRLS